MDAKQITLVQSSWSKVLPISEKAAELFYGRLFEIDPSTKVLFKGDMKEQGRKLMEMITAAVNGLNDLDGLVPVVQDLGRRHGSYGVQDKHYGSVASALLWTLEQGLGAAWTPALKDAWVDVYTAPSGAMIEASAYKTAAQRRGTIERSKSRRLFWVTGFSRSFFSLRRQFPIKGLVGNCVDPHTRD